MVLAVLAMVAAATPATADKTEGTANGSATYDYDATLIPGGGAAGCGEFTKLHYEGSFVTASLSVTRRTTTATYRGEFNLTIEEDDSAATTPAGTVWNGAILGTYHPDDDDCDKDISPEDGIPDPWPYRVPVKAELSSPSIALGSLRCTGFRGTMERSDPAPNDGIPRDNQVRFTLSAGTCSAVDSRTGATASGATGSKMSLISDQGHCVKDEPETNPTRPFGLAFPPTRCVSKDHALVT